MNAINTIYRLTCLIASSVILFASIYNEQIKTLDFSTNTLLMMIMAIMLLKESTKQK